MPQDFLSSLFKTGVEGGDPSSAAYGYDPQQFSADRQADLDAITHAIVTGQPPAQEAVPPGGPIGKLLQTMGLRSKFKPVPGRVQDLSMLARMMQGGEEKQGKLDVAQQMTGYGGVFGSEAARGLANQMGEPGLGATLPKDIKGRGELAASQQDITMQRYLMANDAAMNKIGEQLLATEIRAAAAEGKADRVQQLSALKEQAEQLRIQQMQNKPGDVLYQDLYKTSASRITDLMNIVSKMESDPSTPPETLEKYNQMLADEQEKQQRLIRGRAGATTEEDITNLYYGAPKAGRAPTTPTTTDIRQKKRIKAGTFGD